jgi:hypothetical protein
MNSKKIGIVLVVFILLSIAGGAFLFLNDSKIKFVTLLNKEYKSFATILDDIKNSKIATLSKGTTLTTNSNISFSLSLNNDLYNDSIKPLINTINGLAINLQYGTDNTNGNTFMKFDSTLNNKDFIDVEGYQMGDKKYVYLDGIYDKYISSNSTEVITNQNAQIDDINYLADKIKVAFISALKPSDFTNEKVTIKINDKDINVDRMTLTLTNSRLIEMMKEVLTSIKNDDKCISILKKMSDSGDDIKASLEDDIASLGSKELLTEDIKINMYIADGSITKLEIYEGTVKYLEYLSYITEMTTKVKSISIYDGDSVVLAATFKLISKNDASYQISLANNSLLVNGTVSNVTTETTPNKEFDTKINFSLSPSYGGVNFGTVQINTDTVTKIGEKIDTVDVSNVIDEKDLTEQEQSGIVLKVIQRIIDAIPQIKTNEIETDAGSIF